MVVWILVKVEGGGREGEGGGNAGEIIQLFQMNELMQWSYQASCYRTPAWRLLSGQFLLIIFEWIDWMFGNRRSDAPVPNWRRLADGHRNTKQEETLNYECKFVWHEPTKCPFWKVYIDSNNKQDASNNNNNNNSSSSSRSNKVSKHATRIEIKNIE